MPATKYSLKDLTFGAEIEGLYPRNKQRTFIRICNKYKALRGDESREETVLGTDGSIGDYNTDQFRATEIRTRPYQFGSPHELNQFRSFIQELRENGLETNNTCGAHVHIGVKAYAAKMDVPETMAFFSRLALNFHNIDQALYVFNGGIKRANGEYAHRFKEREMERLTKFSPFIGGDGFTQGDRYHGLNFMPFLRESKTVEFRLFVGTNDPAKWVNNVLLAGKFVQKTAMGVNMPAFNKTNARDIFAFFGVDGSVFTEHRDPFRSKALADLIKPLRKKDKTYNVVMIKAWKIIVKTLDQAYNNRADSHKENAYLLLRRIFADSEEIIVSPNTLFMQRANKTGVTAIKFVNHGCYIEQYPETRQNRGDSMGFNDYIPAENLFTSIM